MPVRALGAAAATTAGLLMLVGPAQAAPAAPTAADQSIIEANNAAVRASLPPNVTMKVIGELHSDVRRR
ncbi:hypothetical protein Adi01nite_44450 [Amorphoplanes digitatis]|nr:hypothetical protein Adi01nite_44450 [Actinoplanes digitatis]